MVRRYLDPVEVQSGDAAPTAFVWRGRLYVVREVLDHWRERRAWWREPPDPPGTEPGPGPEPVVGGGPGPGDEPPGPHDLEQEMWRVVASAGRHRGSGVYDLAGGDRDRTWRLVRVAD